MNACLNRYICSNDGHEFFAPECGAGGWAYGQLTMRSAEGDIPLHLNAPADPVFEEVAHLIRSSVYSARFDARARVRLVQRAFGLACDPAPNGSYYHVEFPPCCPRCGMRVMATWGPVQPPVGIDLPAPTHGRWSRTTDAEKRMLIDGYLRELLAGEG